MRLIRNSYSNLPLDQVPVGYSVKSTVTSVFTGTSDPSPLLILYSEGPFCRLYLHRSPLKLKQKLYHPNRTPSDKYNEGHNSSCANELR